MPILVVDVTELLFVATISMYYQVTQNNETQNSKIDNKRDM